MVQQVEKDKHRTTIRPANERDLPAILEIYNHYVKTSTATFDTTEQTAEQRKQWFEDHVKAGLPVFVAEEDGVVVGWQSLSYYHSRCAYRQTVESSTYVAPNAQHKGIGRRLLETAIAAAQEQ